MCCVRDFFWGEATSQLLTHRRDPTTEQNKKSESVNQWIIRVSSRSRDQQYLQEQDNSKETIALGYSNTGDNSWNIQARALYSFGRVLQLWESLLTARQVDLLPQQTFPLFIYPRRDFRDTKYKLLLLQILFAPWVPCTSPPPGGSISMQRRLNTTVFYGFLCCSLLV